MKTCENCGCRVCNGICTNCQEELYIVETQSEYMNYPVSDEFAEKVSKQRLEVNRRRKVK